MRYDTDCVRCGPLEIEKAMLAPLPLCPGCGRELKRRYASTVVHFAAPGFYSTDVQRFQSQVGSERFARFEAQKVDIARRAKAGRLTDYEHALEQIVIRDGQHGNE